MSNYNIILYEIKILNNTYGTYVNKYIKEDLIKINNYYKIKI